MKNFLCFRTMVTPVIVQILFWVAVVFSVVVAIMNFTHGQYRYGVEVLILGPLLARIASELIIIFFRMNDALSKIEKNKCN